MNMRLLGAIVTTIIWELALAALLLLGLPRLGVDIPLPVLVVLMAALGAWAVLGYLKGSRALARKPLPRLPSMVESRGEVVSVLSPGGTVKIKGELWGAISEDGIINTGETVVVSAQKGLKLTVKRDRSQASQSS